MNLLEPLRPLSPPQTRNMGEIPEFLLDENGELLDIPQISRTRSVGNPATEEDTPKNKRRSKSDKESTRGRNSFRSQGVVTEPSEGRESFGTLDVNLGEYTPSRPAADRRSDSGFTTISGRGRGGISGRGSEDLREQEEPESLPPEEPIDPYSPYINRLNELAGTYNEEAASYRETGVRGDSLDTALVQYLDFLREAPEIPGSSEEYNAFRSISSNPIDERAEFDRSPSNYYNPFTINQDYRSGQFSQDLLSGLSERSIIDPRFSDFGEANEYRFEPGAETFNVGGQSVDLPGYSPAGLSYQYRQAAYDPFGGRATNTYWGLESDDNTSAALIPDAPYVIQGYGGRFDIGASGQSGKFDPNAERTSIGRNPTPLSLLSGRPAQNREALLNQRERAYLPLAGTPMEPRPGESYEIARGFDQGLQFTIDGQQPGGGAPDPLTAGQLPGPLSSGSGSTEFGSGAADAFGSGAAGAFDRTPSTTPAAQNEQGYVGAGESLPESLVSDSAVEYQPSDVRSGLLNADINDIRLSGQGDGEALNPSGRENDPRFLGGEFDENIWNGSLQSFWDVALNNRGTKPDTSLSSPAFEGLAPNGVPLWSADTGAGRRTIGIDRFERPWNQNDTFNVPALPHSPSDETTETTIPEDFVPGELIPGELIPGGFVPGSFVPGQTTTSTSRPNSLYFSYYQPNIRVNGNDQVVSLGNSLFDYVTGQEDENEFSGNDLRIASNDLNYSNRYSPGNYQTQLNNNQWTNTALAQIQASARQYENQRSSLNVANLPVYQDRRNGTSFLYADDSYADLGYRDLYIRPTGGYVPFSGENQVFSGSTFGGNNPSQNLFRTGEYGRDLFARTDTQTTQNTYTPDTYTPDRYAPDTYGPDTFIPEITTSQVEAGPNSVNGTDVAPGSSFNWRPDGSGVNQLRYRARPLTRSASREYRVDSTRIESQVPEQAPAGDGTPSYVGSYQPETAFYTPNGRARIPDDASYQQHFKAGYYNGPPQQNWVTWTSPTEGSGRADLFSGQNAFLSAYPEAQGGYWTPEEHQGYTPFTPGATPPI